MKEAITNALKELKRADHMVYVSLKYTRTPDIIMQIIERLEQALLKMFEVLIEFELPKDIRPSPEEFEKLTPIEKVKIIKKNFKKDEMIIEAIYKYNQLKKMRRTPYKTTKEFRRNVAIKFEDESLPEMNIDLITQCFKEVKEYIKHMIDILDLDEENPLR